MLIAGVFLCISARHAVQDSSRHERSAKEDRLQRSCAHTSFDPESALPTPTSMRLPCNYRIHLISNCGPDGNMLMTGGKYFPGEFMGKQPGYPRSQA